LAAIAQGFYLDGRQFPSGVQGVYVSSIDLYFESADPVMGATIGILETVNGYPSNEIVPFSQAHVLANQVNVSQNASAVTNIVFPAPVFLLLNTLYCFGVYPDGSNPGYNVWTGVISASDVLSGASIYSLLATGNMFLTADGLTWTSYDNECIKFNLYVDSFSVAGGSAVFQNDDSEYFSVANNQGTFRLGETVYYSNTIFQATNVSFSNTTTTVNTTSTTGLIAGQKIYLNSPNNHAAFIANVNSVTNINQFVINTNPVFSESNGSIGLLTSNGGLHGVVSQTNSIFLSVNTSSANSTVFLNSNAGLIIGSQSLATASVVTLNDVPYDTFMPKFSVSIPAVTALGIEMEGTANSFNSYAQDATETPLQIGNSYDFYDEERVIMSKSNEMNFNSGNKSLTITSELSTVSPWLSPAIDTIKLGGVSVFNLINYEDANNDVFISEKGNNGEAINKYVSTTVTLAPGVEAEDLVVNIGAYWPAGTLVYVFGKIQNQYDSDNFVNKAWSPMYTTNNYRSSKVNTQDFANYTFNFNNAPPSPQDSTAYLDTSNNSVVAYTTPASQTFETFNVFAVKIVLLASESQTVPRITDLTALAVASNA
jgi:hypothetical protein